MVSLSRTPFVRLAARVRRWSCIPSREAPHRHRSTKPCIVRLCLPDPRHRCSSKIRAHTSDSDWQVLAFHAGSTARPGTDSPTHRLAALRCGRRLALFERSRAAKAVRAVVGAQSAADAAVVGAHVFVRLLRTDGIRVPSDISGHPSWDQFGQSGLHHGAMPTRIAVRP